MNYKTGYCFLTRDLFDGYNLKNLGLKTSYVQDKYHIKDFSDFVCQVFTFFMYCVLVDIIENGVTFIFPLKGNRHAMIHVKVFGGEQFQRMYAGGKFMGIDFLNSMFRGYQLFFSYNSRTGEREKPIYISHNFRDILYGYINEGREYY